MKKVTLPFNLILAIAFCAATSVSAKDVNLGWSGIGSWTTLPYVVANEKGFFEKEGLKVQLITFRGTNLMLTALLTGDLDYATILPFLTGAAARGLPVRILAAVTKNSSYFMVARPEIGSVKALRGKKIGINSFGSSAVTPRSAGAAWTPTKISRFSRSAAAHPNGWPRWSAAAWMPL